MARDLCLEYVNAFYHVMSRGLNRQFLFLDLEDFQYFHSLNCEAKARYELVYHAYCFMNNHYHLFLQTRQANLSKAMKFINETYARYFLKKYPDKDGHVFKGRYKRKIVQSDQYAKQLSRYIHLNPVEASIVDLPSQWAWSSYGVYAKIRQDSLVDIDWLLAQFGSSQERAQAELVNFTCMDTSNWNIEEHTVANACIGSKQFLDCAIDAAANDSCLNEEVRGYREICERSYNPKWIMDYVDQLALTRKVKTKLLLYYLKCYTSLSLSEIGTLTGKRANTVSKAYKRIKEQFSSSEQGRRLLEF